MPLRPHILELGRHPIGSDWNDADVFSPYWRLYLNAGAGAEVLTADGVYKITAGRLHAIPAWVRFSCRCRREIVHQYVHFSLEGLPGAVSRRVFTGPFAAGRTTAGSPALVAAKADRAQPESVRRLLSYAGVYGALAWAFERLSAGQAAACRPFLTGAHRFAPVLAFIDRRLGEAINNEQLARRSHLSTGQFIRRFSQEMGQTPARYIRERRITAASQRLRFTDRSIDRIAADCGFADRFHFTRVFKRMMGVAPATYRRQERV